MDATGLFTVPAGMPADIFLEFLNLLTGDSISGKIVALLNAGFVLIASARITFLIVQGTMQTASSGEVLGEKGSITFVAPRLLIGMVLMIPLGSGWSAGQILVIEAARSGVGLGSRIWQIIQTDLPSQGAQRLADAVSDADIRRRALQAIEQAVCQKLILGNLQISAGWTEIGNRILTTFPRSGVPRGICGGWEFTPVDPAGLAPGVAAILAAHRQGLVQMANSSQEVAADLLDTWQVNPDDVQRMIDAYRATLRAAADRVTATTSTQPLTSWAQAGSRWHDLARAAAVTAGAYTAFPTAAAIDWHVAGGFAESRFLWGDRNSVPNMSRITAAREAIGLALQGTSDAERLRYAAGSGPAGQGVAGYVAPSEATFGPAPSTTADDSSSLMSRVLEAMRERIGVISLQLQPGESPVGALAAFGATMVHGAWGGIAALAIGGTLAGTAATVLAVMLAPAVLAMLAAGSSLAFIVPLAPYVAWTLAVFGYLLLVFHALLQVPVWGLSHMQLREHNLIPQMAHAGYVLLVRILLTPAVMVVCLYGGTLVIDFVAKYLMASFRTAFDSVTVGQSMPMLFWGGITATTVFTGILLYMIHAVLNMVRHAAGEIMQLGQAGLRIVDGAEHVAPTGSSPTIGAPPAGGRGAGRGKTRDDGGSFSR